MEILYDLFINEFVYIINKNFSQDGNNGEIYYFNFNTGESIWDHPSDEYFRQRVAEERERIRAAARGTTTM